jgi:SAM-dependent methyltransferase
VTAHLHELGVKASGIDLSPEMIALARRAHPHLRFDVGSMTDLNLPDGELGGILAWYSLIHVPPEQHPGIFAAFHRALAPRGHLLLAFHVGDDERQHRDEVGGHAVSFTSYHLHADRVAGQLSDAGFVMHARLLREPNSARQEKAPQGYLLARKPGSP